MTPRAVGEVRLGATRDAIRRLHYYGYPADARLAADVEADVDAVLAGLLADILSDPAMIDRAAMSISMRSLGPWSHEFCRALAVRMFIAALAPAELLSSI